MGTPFFDTGTVDLVGMGDYVDLMVLQLHGRLRNVTREVVALGNADTYEDAMDVVCLVPVGHGLEEPALWVALGLAEAAKDAWGVFDQARVGSPLEDAALVRLSRFFPNG
jgi:hypothetical protein